MAVPLNDPFQSSVPVRSQFPVALPTQMSDSTLEPVMTSWMAVPELFRCAVIPAGSLPSTKRPLPEKEPYPMRSNVPKPSGTDRMLNTFVPVSDNPPATRILPPWKTSTLFVVMSVVLIPRFKLPGHSMDCEPTPPSASSEPPWPRVMSSAELPAPARVAPAVTSKAPPKPVVAPDLRYNVPPWTVVSPPYVLLPARVSVPGPSFTRARPAPESSPT